MAKKEYSPEELNELKQKTYKPYSIHIFDKTYVADANGNLIDPPKAEQYDRVSETITTSENDNKKIDVVKTESGKFYIREHRKGKDGQYKKSKITNQEIPQVRIQITRGNLPNIKSAITTLEANIGGQ